MTENRWLIALTIAAVLVSVVAGVAAQKEKAQAATAAESAKHAHASRIVVPKSSATATTVPVSAPTTTTTTTIISTTTTSTGSSSLSSSSSSSTKKSTTKKSASTTSTVTVRAAAVGDLVQFGKFGGSTLSWRILSLDSKRIVLLSDQVLVAGPYQADDTLSNMNEYSSSSVRSWLNDTFVPAAFGATATTNAVIGRSSASDVIAGDIAYLLTPSQLNRYLPEADDRKAGSSTWAQANNGFGAVPLAAGSAYWWLAPDPVTPDANVAPVVQANGGINANRYAAIATDGVRPAIRLRASALTLKPVTGSTGVYKVVAK